MGKNVLPHFRSDDVEPSYIGQYAHCQISIRHPSIHFEVLEILTRVQLHALDYRLRLERIRFQGRPCDVGRIRVLRNANQEPSCSRVPIGCKESREGGHEVDASGIFLLCSKRVNLCSTLDDRHGIPEPLYGAPGDCN